MAWEAKDQKTRSEGRVKHPSPGKQIQKTRAEKDYEAETERKQKNEGKKLNVMLYMITTMKERSRQQEHTHTHTFTFSQYFQSSTLYSTNIQLCNPDLFQVRTWVCLNARLILKTRRPNTAPCLVSFSLHKLAQNNSETTCSAFFPYSLEFTPDT